MHARAIGGKIPFSYDRKMRKKKLFKLIKIGLGKQVSEVREN